MLKLALRFTCSVVLAGCICACGGGGTPAQQTAPPIPVAVVAHAGTNQNVSVNATVVLDASASQSADQGPLTYAWALTSKPSNNRLASLSNPTAVNPTFVADMDGVYVATLVVSNAKGGTATSTTTITVFFGNAAPAANPGAAQNVALGLVTLDGSASSDADGDPLTYRWTFASRPAGSAAVLSDPTAARPSFTADVPGKYVASLVVEDGKLASMPASTVVTASQANSAPVANAGSAQNVKIGKVSLNGSASSDADGDLLTYRWTLVSKPAGSVAALSNSTSSFPTFTADLAGSYVASLVVNDGKVDSTPATTIVTASQANSAPVANAGAAQSVNLGTVNLNGSASSDADGDVLLYRWSLTSRPAGSAAVLANSATAFPNFTADVEGTYVASLIVNDGKVDSAAATVVITVGAMSVLAQDIVVYANPNVPTAQLNGRLQCLGANYDMNTMLTPLIGDNGAGAPEEKYSVQASGARKAFHFSVRGTDVNTAGDGNKRCQHVFFQPQQAIPLGESFWYGIDVAISDMGNSVDEQLVWQWHINLNYANGNPYLLSPYLSAVITHGNKMTIQLIHNRNTVLSQATNTKITVYPASAFTPNVFHRFIVQATNNRVDNSKSVVKIWLDGQKIVDYVGNFGFYYVTPPSDIISHGLYHWTNGNTWDSSVPERSSWIRGAVLLRDRTGYTLNSIQSLLDSTTISK